MKLIMNYDAPSIANLQRIGAANFLMFCEAGHRIAMALDSVVDFRSVNNGNILPKVLDFGCGVGRVLLQLVPNFPNIRFSGVDVDASAVHYMMNQIPEVNLLTTSFLPPLPFEDGEFDLVYSISIWTHLAPRHQLPWLKELRRIVRPGGRILISTSSGSALSARKLRKDIGWENVTNDDLAKQGVIFVAYPEASMSEWCPGVSEEYGLTLNHPDWIKREFSPLFSSFDLINDAIDGVQDLVILHK